MSKGDTSTADLVREFGWKPVEVGGIDASHYLEATCMVWVCNALRNNDWNRAFKLVPCETKVKEKQNAEA